MSRIMDDRVSDVTLLLNGNYTISAEGLIQKDSNVTSVDRTKLKATEPYVFTFEEDGTVYNQLCVGNNLVRTDYSDKTFALCESGTASSYTYDDLRTSLTTLNSQADTNASNINELTRGLEAIYKSVIPEGQTESVESGKVVDLDNRISAVEALLCKIFGLTISGGTFTGKYYGDTVPGSATEGQLFFKTSTNTSN